MRPSFAGDAFPPVRVLSNFLLFLRDRFSVAGRVQGRRESLEIAGWLLRLAVRFCIIRLCCL